MKNLRGRLVRAGYDDVGWGWVVHPNAADDAKHIHVYANGSVPAGIIREAAVGVGFGVRVDVRPFRRTRRGTEYGFHHIIDRGEPDDIRIDLGRHLDRNGGWLIHAAGPFWRSPNGDVVGGHQLAIQALIRDRRTSQMAGQWA